MKKIKKKKIYSIVVKQITQNLLNCNSSSFYPIEKW